MRVWLPLWSTASCTTARCFTSRDLRFDSKVGHWTASWSPRHLRPPTAPTLDSRLSTALMDRRTQCGERFLGERRCADCNLFARAVGLGGMCPECDTTVLVEELLGEGVVPTT